MLVAALFFSSCFYITSVKTLTRPFEILMTGTNTWIRGDSQAAQKQASNFSETASTLPRLKDTEMDENPGQSNWIVLMTLNHGFFEYFVNWFAHYKLLGIPMKVYVVAEVCSWC